MATTIPIRVYEILEDKLGREEAREIVHEIEASADAIATQKKVEIRDELSKELASKADLSATEARLERKIDALEWKLKLYFLILLFTIILVSPRALDLISRLLGIVK